LVAGEENSPEFDKMTRKAAQALLALTLPEQETALLKSAIDRDLLSTKWQAGERDQAKSEELRKQILTLTGADALVGELLRLAKTAPAKWAIRTRIVLEKAGGTMALARLTKLPADQSPWEKGELDEVIKAIQQRCGVSDAKQPASLRAAQEDKPPEEAELVKLRRTFACGPESQGYGEAFDVLIRHDPGPVADYLVAWKNPSKTARDADAGYVFGSYFAWRCGKERRKHLSTLLQAKDPYV
jgi:hypothetical protein